MTDSALALSDGHVFSSFTAFDNAQRMAKALASSALVPKIYQGQQGLANSLIALELAGRMGISPLTVMQNMTPINGRPSWSSSFLIGTVNACGRFSPLRFIFDDVENPSSCHAEANDLATGEVLRGEKITIAMAKAEGWFSRQGSKWQTFPGQMLRYRAGAFWARVYCPEISLGIITKEEAIDIEPVQVSVSEPQLPETLDDAPEPSAAAIVREVPGKDGSIVEGKKDNGVARRVDSVVASARAFDEARAQVTDSSINDLNRQIASQQINDASEPAATKEVPGKAGSVTEGTGVEGAEGGVNSDVQADGTTSTLNPVSDGVPEAFQDNPDHDPSIPKSVSTATPVAADPLAAPALLKLRDKQQLIRTVNGLSKEKVDELTAALIAEFGFDNQIQMSIQLTHQGHADFIHAFIKGQ